MPASRVFFSGAALVTFGGAYAVLSYVAQQAVNVYVWLLHGEMVRGLALAETTPGPLIMVVQFVTFVGAYRSPGDLNPCRRAAERELLQAKSMLAHFEDLTAQLRVDIAAFGRGGLSPVAEAAEPEPVTWQASAAAVHRVSGVLAFVGDNDDPLAHELRALHAAVSPSSSTTPPDPCRDHRAGLTLSDRRSGSR
jgi:hypothetical protein